MSVAAPLWLTCRITGIEGLPGEDPSDRSTVLRKATLAAITGFGGEEESVTRTTIG
jgi:hypothetical protein